MKHFFSTLLAVITAFFIFSIVGTLLVIGLVASISSAQDDEKMVEIKDNSLLFIRLDQEIADRGKESPVKFPGLENFFDQGRLGLNEIHKALENAAKDPKINGVVLNIQPSGAGLATIQEIRDALLKFKKSGKPVLAYNSEFSQQSYYLSSVADSIFMNPEGSLEWKGLGYQVLFFKDALAKLGIEPQIIRHGTFKSAVEPFMLDKMSDANREQGAKFMGTMWQKIVDDVAKLRKITPAQLNLIADSLLVYDAQSAVAQKMVDKTLYRDEFMARLLKITGKKKEKDLELVDIQKYTKTIPRSAENFEAGKIAVVYASGEIVMDNKGNDDQAIGALSLSKTIREVREDSTVKALVLRINSPGGDALASDIIWRELELTKAKKPVVVSMGDLAASGGYYIACNANYIYAQPTTLTGSIGVFGLFFTGQKLLNEKLGIKSDVVKTNQHSDAMTFTRPFDATERSLAQRSVEKVYNTFTKHVAAGRKMPLEKVLTIAEGRVWSGANALELGLVDAHGSMNDAILKAKELAKLTNYRTVDYPKAQNPLEELMKNFEGDQETRVLEKHFGQTYVFYQNFQQIQQMQGVQARMPFMVDFE